MQFFLFVCLFSQNKSEKSVDTFFYELLLNKTELSTSQGLNIFKNKKQKPNL